ncbi:MAG TPA: sialidase family protein [Candidatus Acidoferrales bacterium]|nr:sialidase family protein [Candidatus Acidoferrales bacterium]
MKKTSKILRAHRIIGGCLLAAVLSMWGCAAETPPPPISVFFPSGNSQTIQQAQSFTINASVKNDSSGKGVTWSFVGPGSLKNQTTGSVEYDAPPSVESVVIATVTATSAADPNQSAPFTVTITYPPVMLTQVSSDTFANGTGQHATEVEPDTFAFGSTITSTFQVSRINGAGAMDIGFATSTDGGATWTNGLLPGITIFQGGSSFNAASDPSVAYDAAHGQWIITSLAIQNDSSGNPLQEQDVVSRSADGLHWGNPVAVNPVASYDKDWIICDDSSSSPFYGHCYIQWSDGSGLMTTSTSIDGGLTWQAPLHTADNIAATGAQPLVQSNGTVIAPILKAGVTDMLAFHSSDGGASWSATTEISPITDHAVAGNLRGGFPSAEMDALGTVYVVWQDCRFRAGCSSNDLVMSTSSDGANWTSPARVPIDPVSSTVDHFLPGLAVDRTTSGGTAHLTLLFYYYPVSACGTVCDLYVGFVSSNDGGQTWSAPVPLAGPMKTSWLPVTPGAVMVGDYFSTSYVNGSAFGVFAVAKASSGSAFDQAMYTTAQPMIAPSAPRFSSKGERPVPNAKSDHPPKNPRPPTRADY